MYIHLLYKFADVIKLYYTIIIIQETSASQETEFDTRLVYSKLRFTVFYKQI